MVMMQPIKFVLVLLVYIPVTVLLVNTSTGSTVLKRDSYCCHAFDVVVQRPKVQSSPPPQQQQRLLRWQRFQRLSLKQQWQQPSNIVGLSLSSKSSESDPSSSFSSSRLFGNQRAPTVDEVQVMDEMIMKLANAKPYDLPMSVQRAYRVISSPRFFVRIAELVDQYDATADSDGSTASSNDDEKRKLIALADNLVATLDAVVSTAQEKMQDYYTDTVERVIMAAAEPDSGEFFVPLSVDRRTAMRTTMTDLDASALEGDTFVSTIDAYMVKSHTDGLDLMVTILQNVLQLYAGRRIYEARQRATTNSSTNATTTAVGELFNDLLQTDSDQWDDTIRNGLLLNNNNNTTMGTELIVEIQTNMESIILSQLESGSMAQRVQAEYLQELVQRIERVLLLQQQ